MLDNVAARVDELQERVARLEQAAADRPLGLDPADLDRLAGAATTDATRRSLAELRSELVVFRDRLREVLAQDAAPQARPARRPTRR